MFVIQELKTESLISSELKTQYFIDKYDTIQDDRNRLDR